MTEHSWQRILDFWFGPQRNGMADASQRKRWFTPDADFDQVCKNQFAAVLEQARHHQLDGWLDHPHGCLAYIVLCDQLPRNIHRGHADAYAWDSLALNAAKAGVSLSYDRELTWDERTFFYLPFEHSESLLDQHTAVGLFSQLRDESPDETRHITNNAVTYAHQHRDIIQRFGRFPHRNATLNRVSSAAEQEFVDQSDGFGQ